MDAAEIKKAQELWRSGLRTLHWSSEPLSLETPWAQNWADIYVAEICEPLGTNWLLTIVAEPEAGCLALLPDATLRTRFRDDRAWRELFLPGRSPLRLLPEPARRPQNLSGELLEERVWSLRALQRAVEDEIERQSGHRFRLRFDDSLASPMDDEVRGIIAEMS